MMRTGYRRPRQVHRRYIDRNDERNHSGREPITSGRYLTRGGHEVTVTDVDQHGFVRGIINSIDNGAVRIKCNLETVWGAGGRWLDAVHESQMDLVKRVGDL